ncbi:MAG: Unknown protein [uncultured Sulfurovum sp.]|uniref:DUF3187 domain-containing protein n=1 Tax=uncultured Sulfurovum sp. TaxID=269237 RepID=A0A6S6TZI0_9BACT|nr:MAG: Unknown protein [uncultured Sulfurovum sp.]
MYKQCIVILILPVLLVAYNDSDLDGVDDKLDQCANTPLTELVDLRGCTIKNLVSDQHFDIVFGQSYAEEGNISLNISEFQMGYYHKKFSLSVSGTYADLKGDTYEEHGLNDLYLDAYYQIKPLKKLRIQLGIGIVFPTYDSSENKTDYRASVQGSYVYENFSFLAGFGMTIVGDSSDDTEFNNSYFYKAGLGYYFNDDFYSSVSYNHTNSIYRSLGDIESLSYYGYYMIDKHWFTNIKFAHGLSDNALDNTVGLKLGYYW